MDLENCTYLRKNLGYAPGINAKYFAYRSYSIRLLYCLRYFVVFIKEVDQLNLAWQLGTHQS